MVQIVRGIGMRLAETAFVVVSGGVLDCIQLLMAPTMRLKRNDECGLACATDAGLHHL